MSSRYLGGWFPLVRSSLECSKGPSGAEGLLSVFVLRLKESFDDEANVKIAVRWMLVGASSEGPSCVAFYRVLCRTT